MDTRETLRLLAGPIMAVALGAQGCGEPAADGDTTPAMAGQGGVDATPPPASPVVTAPPMTTPDGLPPMQETPAPAVPAPAPPEQDPPEQDPPAPPEQDPPEQDPPEQDPPAEDPPTEDPPTGSGCVDGKVVHFVYFVEADERFSEAQRTDIERQAYAFQAYWYEQLGVTFYLNEPVVDVIEGDHDASWYIETRDGIHSDNRWYRLGNMKTEVYNKLGIRDFDPDHRVVNYPTTRADGRVGGNFGGAWMDGDDLTCMAGDNGGVNYPYPGGTSAHCLGHVAHEFGHVLGLGHEGPNSDCMQFGFYNNSGGSGMCDFSAANRDKIRQARRNEGWLTAQPGDTCTGR